MVKIEKEYVFEGPNGRTYLRDLFGSHHQLIIYHFMFDPSWDEGCKSCSHANRRGIVMSEFTYLFRGVRPLVRKPRVLP